MAYVDTPAFMTKSTSRHGGDGRWPPVKRLVIRRANLVVHGNNPENLPGADLGLMEFLGPLLQTLPTLTQTVLSIKQQEDDRKAARAHQAAEDAAAAAATKAAADAAAAQLKTANAAAAASPIAAHLGVDNQTLLIAGGGAAGLLILYLLLRKK
jgi:pyruvate/2-oxoglutarate dehydrogenase complex dihydrolipoamide acyltransferase (E2) component